VGPPVGDGDVGGVDVGGVGGVALVGIVVGLIDVVGEIDGVTGGDDGRREAPADEALLDGASDWPPV